LIDRVIDDMSAKITPEEPPLEIRIQDPPSSLSHASHKSPQADQAESTS
jgi:hypothetical protein